MSFVLLKILCRGNNQWAPPREQLIFHIHQPARYNILNKYFI
jgi:hypothetical protein